MRTKNDINLDSMLKNALEEYLIEDVSQQIASLDSIEEPEYSAAHKQFIQSFFEKTKNKKKSCWKKWCSIAAVFVCCLTFSNHDITGEIKKAYHVVTTKHTDISFDVSKKTVYVEYDLNDFPDAWNDLFLPDDMLNGYTIKTTECNDSTIKITFVNPSGNEMIYSITKVKESPKPDNNYEKVTIKNETGYYYNDPAGNHLMLFKSDEQNIYQIQISAVDLEKKDLIWIAKNITNIRR